MQEQINFENFESKTMNRKERLQNINLMVQNRGANLVTFVSKSLTTTKKAPTFKELL